jgi:hypothetical protein
LAAVKTQLNLGFGETTSIHCCSKRKVKDRFNLCLKMARTPVVIILAGYLGNHFFWQAHAQKIGLSGP